MGDGGARSVFLRVVVVTLYVDVSVFRALVARKPAPLK